MVFNLVDPPLPPIYLAADIENKEAVTENIACWFLLSGRCVDCSHLWGKRLILQLKDTFWEFESPFRVLHLLFSVSFSVCGAEGGGISAFDGVYVV